MKRTFWHLQPARILYGWGRGSTWVARRRSRPAGSSGANDAYCSVVIADSSARPTCPTHRMQSAARLTQARGAWRWQTLSVEPPITRRGRTACDVSHVWHAPRACHGHPHERPRHAGIPPLVSGVIFGLGVDVLGPRRIMLEGRDRPNAASVCAEAVDHGLPVLSDEAGAQLIPATHRPPVRDSGVVCGVKWAQTSRNKLLVD